MPYVDRPVPATGREGKCSFQYTIGVSLLDGAVTPRSFTDERRFRADMTALLPKVERSQADTIPGDLEHMHVEITIDWAEGQRATATWSGPRGFWGLPRLTPDEHLVKIRDCLATRLTPTAIERRIDLATRLETRGPHEVRELIRLAGDVDVAA